MALPKKVWTVHKLTANLTSGGHSDGSLLDCVVLRVFDTLTVPLLLQPLSCRGEVGLGFPLDWSVEHVLDRRLVSGSLGATLSDCRLGGGRGRMKILSLDRIYLDFPVWLRRGRGSRGNRNITKPR